MWSEALALDPDYRYARGEAAARADVQRRLARFRPAEGRRWKKACGRGQRIVQPFIFQAVAESPPMRQACSRIWARDKYPELAGRGPQPRRPQGRNKKIRIGYVSGEFRDQATAILMAGLYERHDREQFEIVALDTGVSDSSPMRARLEKAFDRWIDIGTLSDAGRGRRHRAAQEIDILVNLNGYFGDAAHGRFRPPAGARCRSIIWAFPPPWARPISTTSSPTGS